MYYKECMISHRCEDYKFLCRDNLITRQYRVLDIGPNASLSNYSLAHRKPQIMLDITRD